MTQEEVLKNARTCLGPYCKGCPVCNGRACKNTMPGPGAKGEGDTAIRNYDKWREIRVQMDTLCENGPVDTSLELFGKQFAYPFFAGPVGAVNLHYGDKYDDAAYNDILVHACAEAGIAAFTGDGTNPEVMRDRKGKRTWRADREAMECRNGSREDETGKRIQSLCGGHGY